MLHSAPPAFREPVQEDAIEHVRHCSLVREQLEDAIKNGTPSATSLANSLFLRQSSRSKQSVKTEVVQRVRTQVFCATFCPQSHDFVDLLTNHSQVRRQYLLENLEKLMSRVPIWVSGRKLEPYQRLAVASSACALPEDVFSRASVPPEVIADCTPKRRRVSSKTEEVGALFLNVSARVKAGLPAPLEFVTYPPRSGKSSITSLSFLLGLAFPNMSRREMAELAASNSAARRGFGFPQHVEGEIAPVMIVSCPRHKRKRWEAAAEHACEEAERFYGMRAKLCTSEPSSRTNLRIARANDTALIWIMDPETVPSALLACPEIAFVQLVLVQAACAPLPQWCSPFVKLSVVTSSLEFVNLMSVRERHPLFEALHGKDLFSIAEVQKAVQSTDYKRARVALLHWCTLALSTPPSFMLDCLSRGLAARMPSTLHVHRIACARNSVQDRTIGGFASVDFVQLLEVLSEGSLDRDTTEQLRTAMQSRESFSVERLAAVLESVAERICARDLPGNSARTMSANVRRLSERVCGLMEQSENCPICWESMSTEGEHEGTILSCCTCVVCRSCLPSLSRCPTCRSPHRSAARLSVSTPVSNFRRSLANMAIDEALTAIAEQKLTKSEAVRSIVADVIANHRPNATVLLAFSTGAAQAATSWRSGSEVAFSRSLARDLEREVPNAVITCSRGLVGHDRSATSSLLTQTRYTEFECPEPDSPLQIMLVNANSARAEDAIPDAEFTLVCDETSPSTTSRILAATLSPEGRSADDAPARAIFVGH